MICVSCSSLHTVIPAGEAAACTSPNGLSLVVKEIQYFPIGLPVITSYYKNLDMNISVVSICPVLPSADMTILLWTARRWNANYGSSFARGVLLSSHCCIQNVVPFLSVNGDLLDWNMFTPNKNNWEALQALRKLYPVCKQCCLHLWCDLCLFAESQKNFRSSGISMF